MSSTIRLGVAGVGSCASSLAQVVLGEQLLGIGSETLGDYKVSDIEIVVAFDVAAEKVGADFASAIRSPLNAARLHASVPPAGFDVLPGPLEDGVGESARIAVDPRSGDVCEGDVVRWLRDANCQVLVCLLPTGATEAVQMYARAAGRAGAAFVNGTPEPVARNPELVEHFKNCGVPLLGDDTRSMVGATTLHTQLIELLTAKGVAIDGTYQLNVGGNSDFLNLAEAGRSRSKIESKRYALRGAGLDSDDILAGPNGFAPHLGDRKVCLLNVEGRSVLGSRLAIDLRLEVEDSPNAAGTLVDAIRVARIAIDRGESGAVRDPSCLLFKSPPAGAESHSAASRLFWDYVGGSQ